MTFSIPHVFKALQMLTKNRFVSRASFCRELQIGEGAVKTLIIHLKKYNIVETNRSGTFLTKEGIRLSSELTKITPRECNIEKCSIARGKYNHAIILRNFSSHVTTGLEQRDYAILYGSSGCITLQYIGNKFVFPGDLKDCLKGDKKTRKTLMDKLEPKDGDVIIISSSDDKFVSEISAKNSALGTMAS